jgi:hypothetical protein
MVFTSSMDVDVEVVDRLAIPCIALASGFALLPFEPTKTAGRLLCFLGAQTGMVFYMKEVLSNQAISEGKRGFPAAFAVTGLQQLTGFFLMMAWMVVSRFTPNPYRPKQLSSRMDYIAVLLFSVCFTANIALNNYSMALIPISVNLIIRSCFPLPTFLAQKFVSWCTRDGRAKDSSLVELALMLVGVLCACVAVVAKTRSSDTVASESRHLVWGVTVCVISCFAGSTNLVLAGMMGSALNLNEFDTVIYTALPAAALLTAAMFIPHSVPWGEDGATTMTDWEILKEVLDSNRSVLILAALSGVFALWFNLLKYGIVQRLSATHTAFAGNFNKAFTIILTMMVGLEPYPTDGWGWLMVAAYVGNIGAFTAYNIVKIRLQRTKDTRSAPEDSEKKPPSVGSTEDDTEDKLTRLTSEEDQWEYTSTPGGSCRRSASADVGSYSGLDPAAVPLAASQPASHRGSR